MSRQKNGTHYSLRKKIADTRNEYNFIFLCLPWIFSEKQLIDFFPLIFVCHLPNGNRSNPDGENKRWLYIQVRKSNHVASNVCTASTDSGKGQSAFERQQKTFDVKDWGYMPTTYNGRNKNRCTISIVKAILEYAPVRLCNKR